MNDPTPKIEGCTCGASENYQAGAGHLEGCPLYADAPPHPTWAKETLSSNLVACVEELNDAVCVPHAGYHDSLSKVNAEIQRLTEGWALCREVYRREREAHAANLKEQQKCEAEIERLRAVLEKICTMSCVMGTDSGHAGIDAIVRETLSTQSGEPICRWYHDEGNEWYSYFTECGHQISNNHETYCGHCGRKIQMQEKKK